MGVDTGELIRRVNAAEDFAERECCIRRTWPAGGATVEA
jgi:hypothetical protein